MAFKPAASRQLITLRCSPVQRFIINIAACNICTYKRVMILTQRNEERMKELFRETDCSWSVSATVQLQIQIHIVLHEIVRKKYRKIDQKTRMIYDEWEQSAPNHIIITAVQWWAQTEVERRMNMNLLVCCDRKCDARPWRQMAHDYLYIKVIVKAKLEY